MNLNGLFGWLDYIIYLVQSTNRHGVHSPFVYDFADKVLYRQLANAYEPAAELCRKRMLQSDAKILLNNELKEISLSNLSNKRIPFPMDSIQTVGGQHHRNWKFIGCIADISATREYSLRTRFDPTIFQL